MKEQLLIMFSALPQKKQMDMLSGQFTGQRDLFLGDDPAENEAPVFVNSEPGGGKKEPIPVGAKKESMKPFMAYPSTPVSDNQGGKTPSGNKATWGDSEDLDDLISKSSFLQKKDPEVLMAIVESDEYASFKQLICENGNVTDDEVAILTMFVLGGTPPSTPAALINSSLNLPTETRNILAAFQLKTVLGVQGEKASKLIVEAEQLSKLGHYGIVSTLDHNPLVKILWLFHSVYHAIAPVHIQDRLTILHAASVAVSSMHSQTCWLNQQGWDILVNPNLIHTLERYPAYQNAQSLANLLDHILARSIVNACQLYILASSLTTPAPPVGGENLLRNFGLDATCPSVARRLLTALFPKTTVLTYVNNLEYPRDVQMGKFLTFSRILTALLGHRAVLAVLLGAHAMFDILNRLDRYVVRGFSFLVSNSELSATDPSPTNPNTGTNASMLTDIRRMDRPLNDQCLAKLQRDLLAIDSVNGHSTNNEVSFLGKNLHKPTDVDEDEKPPAVPMTQNNPSGGANNGGGHQNREQNRETSELRCPKCSRPADKCQNRCDPGNQIKPTPGKSGNIDDKKVCRNCGLPGHGRWDCRYNKAQGKAFWKQRHQFIARLPPLEDGYNSVSPYAQASQQHVQQPIQSQGSVGNGQSVIQGAQGVYPQAYGALPQVMPHQAFPQVMPQQAFQNFMPFQNMPPDGHVQVNGSWFAPVQNAKP